MNRTKGLFFGVLLALTTLAGAEGQGIMEGRPAVQRHELKGRVRRVTQVQSPVSNREMDWLDGFSGENYTAEYRADGRLTKWIQRDDFNRPHRAAHYTYDAIGQVASVTDEPLTNKQFGRSSGTVSYSFDPIKKALIVRDNRTIGGRVLNRRGEVIIDSVRRIKHQREYERDTVLAEETIQEWDAQGHTTLRIYRHSPQAARPMFRPSGQETAAIMKEMTGETFNKEEMRLLDSLNRREDSLGRIRLQKTPRWISDTVRYLNRYDANQRLVGQEEWHGGRLAQKMTISYTEAVTHRTRQRYDQAGQLAGEEITHEHPTKKYILKSVSRRKEAGEWKENRYEATPPAPTTAQTTVYQYDRAGNWIERKKVDTDGKQTGSALVRTIEYHQ